MASPNIINVATITGLTTYNAMASTAEIVILNNPSGSGTVFKVNDIIVSNVDGSSSADISLSYRSAAGGGGSAFKLAHTVAVAPDSVLVAIDRSSSIYLEENTCLTAQASAADDLNVIASYEVIG